jgi:hypothetical protein
MLSFTVVSTITTTQAQDNNTPAAFELMKTKSFWRQTSNAGGLFLDNPIQYSVYGVTYQSFQGDFRRPQQGKKGSDLNFSAEGGVTLLDKLYVWGQFDYSRENITASNFNASIIDPYRGMPYYIADLKESDWENQYYNMQFKVSLPVGKSLSIGVDGKYNVAQAAKQRDIRTKNQFYSLNLKPGVVYSPAEEHHIGLNLDYYNIKENSSPSLVNTGDYQTYYELYGLGTAVEKIGSGRTVNYVGDRVGGSLQYNYHKGAINLLVSGDYSYKVEDAEFSFTTPEKYGTAKDKALAAKMLLYVEGEKLSHHFQASYTNSHIDGIQYVKRNTGSEGWQILHHNIRSTYKTDVASADYSLIANSGSEYKWKVGVGACYQKKSDEYLLPNSTKDVENLTFLVNGKVNLFLSEKLSRRLLIGAEAGYNKNLSGQYSYHGNYPDYRVVTELEQIDFNYLASDFYRFGGSVTYSQRLKEGIKANLYVKGDVNYQQTSAFDFGQRTTLQFSLGCNF